MKPDLSLSHQLVAPVAAFAERVLTAAADIDGGTPLLANYLDPDSRRPLRLADPGGGDLLLCNIAGQLTFLRVLQALSVLTGDPEWHERALAICRFALRNARRRGMILWGNHAALDLVTQKPVFLAKKGKVHELKAHYPPYDLLWEADPEALSSYIPYYWHGHLYDWSKLDFSRHGRMDLPDYSLPPDPWGATYQGGPIFFVGGGLTFLNAGSDLYLAAAELAGLTGQPGPMRWARHLLDRYGETRNPVTGMGGYQFSAVFDKSDPSHQRSGDRAWTQFRDQFPDHHPLEGTLSTAGHLRMINGPSALCRFHLARRWGQYGEPFGRAAAEDVEAYAAHSYEPETNLFHPTFTDGFRLTGQVIRADGYFGPAGRRFEGRPADWLQFWSHAAAWSFSGSSLAWSVARSIGRHRGLGDIGSAPGVCPSLVIPDSGTSADACFGLLELDRRFPGGAYAAAAVAVAKTLLHTHLRDGWFVGKNLPVLSFDRPEPLALLHVAALLAGRSGALLPYFGCQALDPLTGWMREPADLR